MVLLIVVGVLVLVASAVLVASVVGERRSRALYEAEKAQLLARGRAAKAWTVDAEAVGKLPPPVQRYLQVTRTAGKPGPKVAILQQTGAIRTGNDKPWILFEAEQTYSMDPPGFVWLAKASAAPMVSLWARDKFVDRTGNMLIRILGVITVADGRGPGMDQGAGLRYWGEVISFPEMVLSPYLRWEPLDDRQAKVFVEQEGLRMEATLEFGQDGLPSAFHAMRYRDVNGESILTPWSGFTRDWKAIDGRLFPSHWESVWHTPEGDLLGVKMDVHAIRTE